MDRSPFLSIIYNYLELKCYLRTQAAKTNKQTKKTHYWWNKNNGILHKEVVARQRDRIFSQILDRKADIICDHGMRVWLINVEKKLYMKAKILLSEELTRLNVKALIVRTGCNYLPWSILTFLTDTIVVLQ